MRLRSVVIALVVAGSFAAVRAEKGASAPAAAAEGGDKKMTLKNAELPEFQVALMDLAFKNGSTFPFVPYMKARQRAQEDVVEAALELDQPGRALAYLEQIKGWRRGQSYALLAEHLMNEGRLKHVDRLLDLALRYGVDPRQAWRGDTVRARVAQLQARLGRIEEAESTLKTADDAISEAASEGELALMAGKEYGKRLEFVEELLKAEGYEQVRAGLYLYAALYDQNYSDSDRREELKERILAAWRGVPGFVQMDVYMKLIEAALRHDDKANALRLIDEAEARKNKFVWLLEMDLPMRADLVKQRFRAGDEDGAKKGLEEAVDLFDEQHQKLQSFQRADGLRPLAEAYAVAGDEAKALEAYRRTVELGVVNPNQRVRIEDFTATCLSMALHEVAPDDKLWARLRQIHEDVASSW